MRLPQFTASASLGTTGNDYVGPSAGPAKTAGGEVAAQIVHRPPPCYSPQSCCHLYDGYWSCSGGHCRCIYI